MSERSLKKAANEVFKELVKEAEELRQGHPRSVAFVVKAYNPHWEKGYRAEFDCMDMHTFLRWVWDNCKNGGYVQYIDRVDGFQYFQGKLKDSGMKLSSPVYNVKNPSSKAVDIVDVLLFDDRAADSEGTFIKYLLIWLEMCRQHADCQRTVHAQANVGDAVNQRERKARTVTDVSRQAIQVESDKLKERQRMNEGNVDAKTSEMLLLSNVMEGHLQHIASGRAWEDMPAIYVQGDYSSRPWLCLPSERVYQLACGKHECTGAKRAKKEDKRAKREDKRAKKDDKAASDVLTDTESDDDDCVMGADDDDCVVCTKAEYDDTCIVTNVTRTDDPVACMVVPDEDVPGDAEAVVIIEETVKERPRGKVKPEPGVVVKPEPGVVVKPEPGVVVKPEPGVVVKPEPGVVVKPEPGVMGWVESAAAFLSGKAVVKQEPETKAAAEPKAPPAPAKSIGQKAGESLAMFLPVIFTSGGGAPTAGPGPNPPAHGFTGTFRTGKEKFWPKE